MSRATAEGPVRRDELLQLLTEEQTWGPERTLLPQQAGDESFVLTGEVQEKGKGGRAVWLRSTPGQ